jgi:hypothetical protein
MLNGMVSFYANTGMKKNCELANKNKTGFANLGHRPLKPNSFHRNSDRDRDRDRDRERDIITGHSSQSRFTETETETGT